jgi:PAS domain S-box-containing protein
MTNIHQRYRSLFNNELLGVYCSTPGGTYQTVNKTFARIFGYDSAQQLLSEVRDIARQLYVDPEDRTRTRDLVLASGCCTVEVQARRRDGSLLWIRNHTWIVRDRTTSDGPPVSAHPNRCPIPYDPGSSHFEGFIQDITAQKMAAEELRVCQEELEARASNSEAQFRKIFMKVPAVVTLSRVRTAGTWRSTRPSAS